MSQVRLKRRKRPKMGLRKEIRVRSVSHLRWVRGFLCLIAGNGFHVCFGKPEAHHVRRGTDGALGIKPSDSFTVPVCSTAHREIHDKGEERFGKEYDINLLGEANKLWRMSPHRFKWEREREKVNG